MTRVLPPGKPASSASPNALSTLTLEVPNIVLVEARAAKDGVGVILHLREIEGKSTTIEQGNVITSGAIQKGDEVNVLEETVESDIQSLTFKPYEVKFVRLVVNP